MYNSSGARSARERLIELHDGQHCSWRQIARMETYAGISIGTLSDIYHGQRIPDKYLRQLGAFTPSKRIAISKVDPASAARSMVGNIEPEVLLEIIRLIEKDFILSSRIPVELDWSVVR